MPWSTSFVRIHDDKDEKYFNSYPFVSYEITMSFFVIPVTALHRKLPFGIGNRAFPAIQGIWNMY